MMLTHSVIKITQNTALCPKSVFVLIPMLHGHGVHVVAVFHGINQIMLNKMLFMHVQHIILSNNEWYGFN